MGQSGHCPRPSPVLEADTRPWGGPARARRGRGGSVLSVVPGRGDSCGGFRGAESISRSRRLIQSKNDPRRHQELPRQLISGGRRTGTGRSNYGGGRTPEGPCNTRRRPTPPSSPPLGKLRWAIEDRYIQVPVLGGRVDRQRQSSGGSALRGGRGVPEGKDGHRQKGLMITLPLVNL